MKLDFSAGTVQDRVTAPLDEAVENHTGPDCPASQPAPGFNRICQTQVKIAAIDYISRSIPQRQPVGQISWGNDAGLP